MRAAVASMKTEMTVVGVCVRSSLKFQFFVFTQKIGTHFERVLEVCLPFDTFSGEVELFFLGLSFFF